MYFLTKMIKVLQVELCAVPSLCTLLSFKNGIIFSFIILQYVTDFLYVLLQGRHQVVDTTALVRSCVQSAVGMLRDQVESGVRSTRRVEILLTLLSDGDEIKGTKSLMLL